MANAKNSPIKTKCVGFTPVGSFPRQRFKVHSHYRESERDVEPDEFIENAIGCLH